VKRFLGLPQRDVDTDFARRRCGRSHNAGAPVRLARSQYRPNTR
jgi:hypothetical protein